MLGTPQNRGVSLTTRTTQRGIVIQFSPITIGNEAVLPVDRDSVIFALMRQAQLNFVGCCPGAVGSVKGPTRLLRNGENAFVMKS